MSWFGDLIGDFFDPLGFFHTTTSKKQTNDQWNLNYGLQARALLDQEAAFEYQKEYDKWAQGFAQSQDRFSRQSYNRSQSFSENAFNQQMALAKSPVSTVVKDASSVGINPMAAMGMSAGSASASGSSFSPSSAPSSSAHEGFGASSLAPINNMPSIISALGSVGSAHIATAQDDKDSRRSAALRQQELDIIKDKNERDFMLANRSLDIEQQNADSNTSQAKTAQGNLTARQAELAFEKIKTKNYYNLEKNMNAFTQKMSRQQFERAKYEFNAKLNLEKQDLSQKLRAIKDNKDFRSGFLRMQYITRFGDKALDLLGQFFGVGGSQAEGFRDDFLNEMLEGGL